MYVEDVDLCWRLHRLVGQFSTSRQLVLSMSRAFPPPGTPIGCSRRITGRSSGSFGSTSGRERLFLPLVAVAVVARLGVASPRCSGGAQGQPPESGDHSGEGRSNTQESSSGPPEGCRSQLGLESWPVPRNSISRRVACRAASIGGSRSYRQRTPLGWYSIVLAVCVIGLGLIVFSRHELEVRTYNASTTTTTTQANTTAPLASDHWQVALSVDICGTVINLPRSANLKSGIITDGNGVVDIEPARAGKDAKQFEGADATWASS